MDHAILSVLILSIFYHSQNKVGNIWKKCVNANDEMHHKRIHSHGNILESNMDKINLIYRAAIGSCRRI